MERREYRYSYELTVVQEPEGTCFILLRNLSISRIVIDARFPRNDKIVSVEIDTQTGDMTTRAVL